MKGIYGLTGPSMSKNNFSITSLIVLLSARLTKNGFTEPKDIFSGERGFWRMISTNYCDLDEILSKTLDKEYKILDVAFKPYSCCRLIHSSIDAVLNAASEDNIKFNNIKAILVKTISPLPRQPFSTSVSMSTIESEAQFNGPYTIACALRNIRPLEWYGNRNFLDVSLMELNKKINFKVSHSAAMVFQRGVGKIQATAIIYTKQGKKYSNQVEAPKGDPRNPIVKEDKKI